MEIRKRSIAFATGCGLATAAISGTNNFFSKIVVAAVGDPIVFTTLKNAIAIVFLLGVVTALRKWREVSQLARRQWLLLGALGAVGGSVPFALYFTGLAMTSAPAAVLIRSTLVIWALVFGASILGERMTLLQGVGVAAVVTASLFVGGFTGFRYNAGELLILGATVLWGAEAVIAKVALRDVSASVAAAARMTFGSVVLLAIIAWQGKAALFATIRHDQWGWTVLTSVLLTGYILSWYAALQHAPVVYAASLLACAPLITSTLSAVYTTGAMSGREAVRALLVIAGAILVIAAMRRESRIVPAAVPAR